MQCLPTYFWGLSSPSEAIDIQISCKQIILLKDLYYNYTWGLHL